MSAALNALARDGRLVREEGIWKLRGEAPASTVPAIELDARGAA